MYYSTQTKKAKNNFNLDYHNADLDLIYSIVQIKIAAAKANYYTGRIDKSTEEAIVKACEEVLSCKHDEEFVTCAIQGGAGTSINMNVNEVIAGRASEIAGCVIHPNDHVNCSQSTNDVNPTALRILIHKLLVEFIQQLLELEASFKEKASNLKEIRKVARTHIQDAVPTTLGDEFLAYSSIVEKHIKLLRTTESVLKEINLGGTAIGSGINATETYRKRVVEILSKEVNYELKSSKNLMSSTSSATDFVYVHDLITALFVDLSKISTDLRILASGPRAGISEIKLKPMQSGSSIMPGKVNPVLPELVNQVYFFLIGKNLTIKYASEQANLELCVMFPVIADSMILSLKLANSTIPKFIECIRTLDANEKGCMTNLEASYAYSTYLIKELGYDLTSNLVKKANKEGSSLRKIIVEEGVLSNEDFDRIVCEGRII